MSEYMWYLSLKGVNTDQQSHKHFQEPGQIDPTKVSKQHLFTYACFECPCIWLPTGLKFLSADSSCFKISLYPKRWIRSLYAHTQSWIAKVWATPIMVFPLETPYPKGSGPFSSICCISVLNYCLSWLKFNKLPCVCIRYQLCVGLIWAFHVMRAQ